MRFKLLINRSATGKAFGEASNESENLGRINRRKTDRRQFFEPELRPGRKRKTVDLLFRSKQEHFVSAFPKNFSDGDSGKEMSTRPSTCNDRVHVDCGLLIVGGSAAPRAMLKITRLRRQILTSSKGLLDPPPFAAFIPIIVDLPVKFAVSFALGVKCVSCWPVPKRPADKYSVRVRPRTNTRLGSNRRS